MFLSSFKRTTPDKNFSAVNSQSFKTVMIYINEKYSSFERGIQVLKFLLLSLFSVAGPVSFSCIIEYKLTVYCSKPNHFSVFISLSYVSIAMKLFLFTNNTREIVWKYYYFKLLKAKILCIKLANTYWKIRQINTFWNEYKECTIKV